MKNAFLHWDLDEEVLMELALGFDMKFGLNKVCKLRKALYGLKQSQELGLEGLRKQC